MQKKGLRYARGWDLFIVYNDQLLKTLPKEERLAGTHRSIPYIYYYISYVTWQR